EWEPRSKQVQEKLEVAEQAMAHFVSSPPLNANAEARESHEFDDLEEVETEFQEALAKEICGRAYADLGRIERHFCRYDEAIRQYTLALNICPDAKIAKIGREAAQKEWGIWKSIKQHLPANQHMEKLFPFPVRGRKLWAVMTCEDRNGPEANGAI